MSTRDSLLLSPVTVLAIVYAGLCVVGFVWLQLTLEAPHLGDEPWRLISVGSYVALTLFDVSLLAALLVEALRTRWSPVGLRVAHRVGLVGAWLLVLGVQWGVTLAYGPLPTRALSARERLGAWPAGAQYGVLDGSLRFGPHRQSWNDLPFERITLEASGCFGPCPVHRIELLRGGLACYEGGDHAPRTGSFEGSVNLWSYAWLCALIERIGFEQMRPAYSGGWTCDESVVIEVFRPGGQSWKVLDYGRVCPPELFALRQAIETTAEDVDWTPAKH